MSVESLRGMDFGEPISDELIGLGIDPEIFSKEFKENFEQEMIKAMTTCHCQSCGINLNLENSLTGRECIMCAIPMMKEEIKPSRAFDYSTGLPL